MNTRREHGGPGGPKADNPSALAPTLGQLVAIALPQMGLMLCHLGISMTDLWVAGRIDAKVLASLGVVSQVFVLFMLVTSIAASGALASVSQALGAGLPMRAKRYAGLILTLAMGSGSVVGLLGYFSAPFIFSLLRVPEELLPVVRVFVSVYCLNLPFYYTLILMNSIFRAYKLVMLPFATFVLVFLVNLAGSVGFGLGWWGLPAYGYQGVVWSTFGATMVGMACSIAAIRRHSIITRASFAPWRWNVRAMPYLLRVGVPSALGQLVEHGGRLLMVTFITTLPGAVDIMAGMTLGMRVQSIVMFPLGAVSLTMAIFSGHLLGAGREDVLFRFAGKAALGAALVFACLAFGLYSFRESAAAFMAPRPEVIKHAAHYLSFSCIGIPVMACVVTLHGLFSGAGATKLVLVSGIVSMWGVQVPLGWYLSHRLGWGESGVYISMLSMDFVYAGLSLFFFCTRKWLHYGARKRKKIVSGEKAHA